MGAQLGRALRKQERGLTRRIGLDDDDGDGRALQAAGIDAAAQVEAPEMRRDPGAQRLIERIPGHAPTGLRKVQTTAGGMLRQMRGPRVPTIRSP